MSTHAEIVSSAITVNGKSLTLRGPRTVAALLVELGYKDSFVAVAVNHACVRKSEYPSFAIQAGDEVEILAPMSGG